MLRLRTALMLLALTLAWVTSAAAAEPGSRPTQRDWMQSLVEGLGWSFGLPEKPEDEDYLRILSGRRTLRVEAEEAKQPSDPVAVKDFKTFGAFSGSGWVSGVATPTTAHLKFLLPLSGTYQVSASLRLPGHRITLAGREQEVSGENAFTTVDLGAVTLDAGMHEVVVALPPNGAIDYLEFEAPDLSPVAPRGGWSPDAPLARDDLAVTAVRLLGIEGLLPEASVDMQLEAESAADLGGAAVATTRYLGIPSGERWVRAGTAPALLKIPFTITLPGVYRVNLAGTGAREASVQIGSAPPLEVRWPAFLGPVTAGSFFLECGRHTLQVTLAPGAGLDYVHLQALRSDPENYLQLAGLEQLPEPPTAGAIDRLLGLLAGIGSAR